MNVRIFLTSEAPMLDECAALMARSDPWKTLNRTFQDCRDSLQGMFREVYVAQQNRDIIGLFVLQMQGTFAGYLQSICIAPEMREMGVGTQMIRYAEEYVFKTSPNFFLCVSGFNKRALKLYQSLGYEEVGVLKNFVANGMDEILMRKTMSSWNDFKTQSN